MARARYCELGNALAVDPKSATASCTNSAWASLRGVFTYGGRLLRILAPRPSRFYTRQRIFKMRDLWEVWPAPAPADASPEPQRPILVDRACPRHRITWQG